MNLFPLFLLVGIIVLSESMFLVDEAAAMDEQEYCRKEWQQVDEGGRERNGYCNIEHSAGEG